MNVTKVLAEGAKLLGINVIDHYIFTPQKEYKSLYSENDIYKSVQASLNFEERNTFEDVRVRQIVSDKSLGTIFSPGDFFSNLYELENIQNEDMVFTFINNQGQVKCKSSYAFSMINEDDESSLIEQIFKQAIMNNATRLLVGYDDAKNENQIELNDFLGRVGDACNLFGIELLDIMEINNGSITSLIHDHDDSIDQRMILEPDKVYIKKEEGITKMNLEELNHEELISLVKDVSRKDYKAYFKALISIESNIDEPVILDLAYESYMNDDSFAGVLDEFIAGVVPFSPLTHEEFLKSANTLLEAIEGCSYSLSLAQQVSRDIKPLFSLVDTSAFHKDDLSYLKRTMTSIAVGELSESLLPSQAFVNEQALNKVFSIFEENEVMGDFKTVAIDNYIQKYYDQVNGEDVEVHKLASVSSDKELDNKESNVSTDKEISIEVGDVIVNAGRTVSLISDKDLGVIITSEIESGSHYEVDFYNEAKDNYSIVSLTHKLSNRVTVDRAYLLQELNTNHNLVCYNPIEYKKIVDKELSIEWTDFEHQIVFDEYQDFFKDTDHEITSIAIDDDSKDGAIVPQGRIVVKLNDGSGGHFDANDTSELSNLLKQTMEDSKLSMGEELGVAVKP